jgi:hypothetical protein
MYFDGNQGEGLLYPVEIQGEGGVEKMQLPIALIPLILSWTTMPNKTSLLKIPHVLAYV